MLRFAVVGLQKIFVQRRVVVVVVTSGSQAGVKREVGVTGAILGNIFVAVEAVVGRLCHTHRAGSVRFVFDMARNAIGCIDFFQQAGFCWVVEFRFGMGIACQFEFGRVAIDACRVGHSVFRRMTHRALHFNLIMPVRRFTGKKRC